MGQSASLAVQFFSPIPTSEIADSTIALAVPLQLQSCGCSLAGFAAGAALGVALHEVSHVVAAFTLGLFPDVVSAAAAAAGVLQWVAANAEWLPLYLLGVSGCISPGDLTKGGRVPRVALPLPAGINHDHWRVAVVRHVGWISSALMAAVALLLARGPAASAVSYGAAAASIVILLGALASDLLGLDPRPMPPDDDMGAAPGGHRLASQSVRQVRPPYLDDEDHVVPGAGAGTLRLYSSPHALVSVSFFCGNIGLLIASAAGSAVDMMSVLRSQVAISSQRGAQSGGLVALVEAAPGEVGADGSGRRRAVVDGVRSRCAPGKRDHLSVALHRRFGRALGRAPRLAGGHGIFVGHTRFATSSQPSEGESHPHQWSPPFNTPVWRASAATGRLEVAEEKFGVWITHNGDFDFWRLMGQDRTHSEVAAFLAAALGCPSPAKCDSVRVAGMIELLRTQGLWFASLRLAYYDTAVRCSFADVVASAEPSYATKQGGGGSGPTNAHDEDPEGNRRSRVATRSELQALAAAIEAAFEGVISSVEPDSPAALFEPTIAGLSAYGQAAPDGGASAVAGASGASPGGPCHLAIHLTSAHGGGGGVTGTASFETSAHGGGFFMPQGWCVGGVGSGRPSIAASAGAGAGGCIGVVDVSDLDAAALAAAATPPSRRHRDDAVEFVLQRRPSFGAVAGESLAGAVLAAQMSAAVQRAALDHSTYGGSELGEPDARLAFGAGASSRLGNLEARRPLTGFGGSAFHLSLYGDPAAHGGAASGVSSCSRRVSSALGGGAGFGGTSYGTPFRRSLRCIEIGDGLASFGSLIAPARVTAVAANGSPSSTTLNNVADPNRLPAGAATATATNGSPAGAGAGHHGSAPRCDAADIPVSYGQEAVRMACALGWARDGSRRDLVAALVEAANKHLKGTPGWPAWRSTVPSLERLISTALSYFVANDLYTASCRFLKHAKGSFGLAILCSLEPDRLCMGAWGQPMSMSFSQAHRAVLYGSETACAMIPIATRAGAPALGGGKNFGTAAAIAVDDAIVTHATNQLFEVNRVEERLADTITLNGNTVEVIRDTSRYSARSIPAVGGGGGATGYSNYSLPARGGSYTSHHVATAGSGCGGHSTYNVYAGSGGHSMYNVQPGNGGRNGGDGAVTRSGKGDGAGGVVGGGSAAVQVAAAQRQPELPSQRGPLGESVERPGRVDTAAVAAASITAGSGAQQAPQLNGVLRSTMSYDVIRGEMCDVVKGYEDAGMPSLYGAGPEGEEGEAVLVDNGWGPAFATHRIDIDEGSGEMMQLVLTDPSDPASANDNADGWSLFRVRPFVRLRVYQLRTGREMDSREDFEAQERIVQLVGNPYVTFNPNLNLHPGRDYVADDLADVSRVLARVRESWTDPLSLNRQTAEDLYQHLDKLVEFAANSSSSGSCDRPGIDLLITGVEASLWLAEQWAGDLKLVFPQLNVQAVSANKVISVLGNARGRIPPTGSTFCRSSASFLAEHHTLCIAVSQSGQTFPSIHAARILNQLLPGRVYAMCGSVDTKMALALGQRMALNSPFTRRVFNTCAGGRCAEPPSVVCVALHQTMSELLSYLVICMRMTSVCASGRPLGMILTKDDMVDLRSVRDRFIDLSAPQLTGYDASGRKVASEHHCRLVDQGRRWALHVIETPTAWVLSLVHILATVVSGWPVVYAVVHGICLAAGAGHVLDTVLSKLALAVDSVVYMFLPIIYAVILRAIQRRPLWHRMGKRTIVVADVPYVHQIIETFVSKMYALSYGIASVEVHGANPVDHFVHRFTHRVVRGLLIALGRPDGRLYSQTKSESWVLLGLLQAKVITSWGHQPEVVSIGHNPYHPAVVDAHLQLPTNRPRLLVEALENTSGAVDPNQLWASRRHMVMSKFPLHDKARKLLQEMEGAAAGAASRNPGRNGRNASNPGGGGGAGPSSLQRPASLGGNAPSSPQRPASLGGNAPSSPQRPASQGGNASGAGARPRGPPSQGRLARSTKMRLMASGGPCNAYSNLSAADVLNMPADQVRPLLGRDSKHLVGGHLLYGIFKKAELRKMWDKLAVVRQLASVLSTKQVSESVAREAVAAVGSTLEGVLHKQTVMEQLLESRYLSLERLLAFMVMFHAMARRTADWWPLTFDIARSQSGLRVATTAAPVTASELEQSLAETLAGDVVEAAAQRDEMAGRERLRQILSAYVRRRTAAGPRRRMY